MNIDEFGSRFKKRSTYWFKSQICSIQNLYVWIALEQIDRKLMEGWIDEAHAFIWQNIRIRWIGKLCFVVGHNIFEEARKLFTALIGNVS